MKKFFFTILCLFSWAESALGMEDRDEILKKTPISSLMREEGFNNYEKYRTPHSSDLLDFIKQEKYEDFHVFTLQKLTHTLRTGGQMSLLLVNVCRAGTGRLEMFEWDENLGDKNYEIIDQHLYTYGFSSAIRHPQHCTGVRYNFSKTIGNTVWCYTKEEGYYQEERRENPLWLCNVSHIYTEKKYQNKGIAKLAIGELIKFIFHSTSVDFINASIASDRVPSQSAFRSQGFDEVKEINKPKKPNHTQAHEWSKSMEFMTLDGENVFIRPSFCGGSEGNFYLPRMKWESITTK